MEVAEAPQAAQLVKGEVTPRDEAQELLDAPPVSVERLAAAADVHAAARARLASLVMLSDACPTGRAYLSIDGSPANPVPIPTDIAQVILGDLIATMVDEVKRIADAINAAIKVLP